MKLFRSAFLIIPIAFIISVAHAADKDVLVLKPITVTASRIYSESSKYSPRSHDEDNFLKLKDSLVDSRTRGPKGIQDDISMRASTFEEALVLLNGVRINDPQTGHFTMDIPLTRLDIDKVDIVYGPSSAFYGSSGVGGSINILVKQPEEKPCVEAELEGGQYDYYMGALALNLPVGALKNRFSFEASRSGGYMAETEFDRIVADVNSNVSFENGYVDFLFGYLNKNFGADSFYSDMYHNEEEHNDTRLLKLDASLNFDEITFKPVLYYRRHWDKFILDRNRRDWYMNFHKNYLYGAELSILMESPLGDIAYGVDLSEEKINSSSLGKHSRYKCAVFLEDRKTYEKWFFDIGARLDYYSSFGTEFNPSVGLGIFLKPDFKLRTSIGRAFRVPTFTDLYYNSPANAGNPDLSPEKSWSVDFGGDYEKNGMLLSGTAFLRFTEGIIDWTRTGTQTVWRSKNCGTFNVGGIEAIFSADPRKICGIPNVRIFQIKYGYTESFKKESIVSKYVLNYLMHNLVMETEYETVFGIVQKLTLSYKKRVAQNHYFLLGTTISKEIDLSWWKGEVFFEGENLLNANYTENGSVRMPGVWVTAGLKMKF